MGRTISAYVVNFARTGDPNGTGLPAWPRYTSTEDRLMDFNAAGQALPQKDPWGADIDLHRPRELIRNTARILTCLSQVRLRGRSLQWHPFIDFASPHF